MFSNRPLTWLFVAATISVDLVLFGFAEIDGAEEKYAVLGFVIGQIAVMGIWSIRGTWHRLLRISVYVISIWLLQFVIEPSRELFAYMFVYGIAIAIASILVEIFRLFSNHNSTETDRSSRLRFPIIEFFGWTIVLAFVCLGYRAADFSAMIAHSEWWTDLFLLLILPLLLICLTQKDLRDLSIGKAVLLLGVFLAAEWYLVKYYEVYLLLVGQAAYLLLWLVVLTLDNIRFEAMQIESQLIEDFPKLHNSQPVGQAVPDDTE